MNAATLPPNLERAARAAVTLGLGPARVVENAARAAAFDFLDRRSRGGPDYYNKMSPEGWLAALREHMPPKHRLKLLLGCRALPRVWCRELSVLDCEADGERWVWYVAAKPANDTEVCTCTIAKDARLENPNCPLHFPRTRAPATDQEKHPDGAHPAENKPKRVITADRESVSPDVHHNRTVRTWRSGRKTSKTLTAWLREEGLVSP
ncbi:MAG: hypothetical protein ACOY0T_09455 [Myxococcota bacterium]